MRLSWRRRMFFKMHIQKVWGLNAPEERFFHSLNVPWNFVTFHNPRDVVTILPCTFYPIAIWHKHQISKQICWKFPYVYTIDEYYEMYDFVYYFYWIRTNANFRVKSMKYSDLTLKQHICTETNGIFSHSH